MSSNLSTITRGMEFEETTISIHRVTELSLHESSQRQDPVTIYCFPDELLAKIFHSVHDQLSWTWNWETIAHVCQWWRIVALNDSTLWSEIEVYLDRRSFVRARTYLERSGMALISVNLSLTEYEEADDDDESTANSEDEGQVDLHRAIVEPFLGSQAIMEFIDFIRDHTSRISSLTINLNETMLTTLFRELPFSFPSLWHLQIENDTINSEIVPILPAFVEEHPPLHKLSLRRVIIPFHLQGSTFFCNLRELSIWYQYGTMNDNRNGGGALTPSLTSLLGVLECCNTQLLLLELVHLNFKGSSLSSDNRMVELPSLKRLLLKSEAGQIASLLSHLILPPKCVLRLYGGELTQTSSHGLKEILPRNHRLLPSLQEIKELHFRANTSDYTVNIDGNPSSALFQIDLDWNEDVSIDDLTPLFINVVADIPFMFPNAKLKILYLACDFTELSSQRLRTILDQYSLLEDLRLRNFSLVHSDTPDALHHILNTLHYDPIVNGEFGPICPRIKILHLINLTLDDDWFDHVQRCLISRKTGKLEHFRFTECRGKGRAITDWNVEA